MLRVSGFVFSFFWLGGIVFFPTFIGGMSLHAGQKILYLLYPLFAIALALSVWLRNKTLYVDTLALLLFTFFVFLLCSVLSKVTFLDTRLFLAHFRYFAYFFLFVGVYNYVACCQLSARELVGTLTWLVIAILLFVVVQLLQPTIIEPLGITNRDGIGRLGFRIGGPMVWSYGLAFILIPIYSYVLISLFIRARFLDSLLFMAVSLTILGGQSKAAYLAVTFCAALLLFLSSWLVSASRCIKISFFFFTCFVAVGAFVVANLDAFGNISRFAETLSGNGVDASTQTRLNQLNHLQYTIEHNIWLGYPKHYVVIENAYGYYFYNYGILGLLGYVSVLSFIWLRSLKLFFIFKRHYGAAQITKLAAAALCFASSGFIFSLANSPLDGHKTAYFYWSFFAAYFGLSARIGFFGVKYR